MQESQPTAFPTRPTSYGTSEKVPHRKPGLMSIARCKRIQVRPRQPLQRQAFVTRFGSADSDRFQADFPNDRKAGEERYERRRRRWINHCKGKCIQMKRSIL